MQNSIKAALSALRIWVNHRLKSNTPDWNQNDSTGEGYIKNKPFYTDGKKVVTLDKKYLPSAETYLDENILRPDYEIHDATQNGYIKNRPCYYFGMDYTATESKTWTSTGSSYWDIGNRVTFVNGYDYRVVGNIECVHSSYPGETFSKSFDFIGRYGSVYFSYPGVKFDDQLAINFANGDYFKITGLSNPYDDYSNYSGALIISKSAGIGGNVRQITVTKFNIQVYALKQLDEKFIPDTIARTEDIPTVAQPDWNQNDPNAADYINGRTHWVETVVNVEWDGDISGLQLEYQMSADGAGSYGPIPFDGSIDDLIGATVKMTDGKEYIIAERGMNSDRTGLSIHSDNRPFVLAYTTTDSVHVPLATWTGDRYRYVGQTNFVETAGLYLWYNGQDDRVLSVKKETIHALDEKFIPDTIARKSDAISIDEIDTICGMATSAAEEASF
jgi:hypothetical protein